MFVKEGLFKKIARRLCLAWLNRIENNNNVNFETNGEKLFIENAIRYICKASDHITLIDVGANAGDYSDVCLRLARNHCSSINIYCFEPLKKNYTELVNRFHDIANIHVFDIALSDHNGSEKIYYNDENPKLSSLYKRNLDIYGIKLDKKEIVETLRLDSFIEREGIVHINLLKIDVEGHEMAVLSGLNDYLDPKFIDFIQFEYGGTNLDAHTSLLNLYAMLESAGFLVSKVMPRGLEIRPYRPYMDNFQYANYVAVSPRILELVK